MSAVPVETTVPGPQTPTPVVIGGQRAVVWTDADGVVRAARDVCPHRRAPLSAGTVVDGELRCPYHGWTYDGRGRCTLVPALGPGGRIPARAQLEMLPVPERGLGPAHLQPAPSLDRGVDDGLDRHRPVGGFIDGDTPGLARIWHPVARRDELPTTGEVAMDVELLGDTWRIGQDEHGGWSALSSDGTPAWGAAPHLDHLWLAPLRPAAVLPDVAEWGQDGWHHRRMRRAEGRFGVGLLLDNQLDAGHFPFVHRSTYGSPAVDSVPAPEIVRNGTTLSTTMQVPNAATNDPRALARDQDLHRHRTLHHEFHAPLWLRVQLDDEDPGGSTLILFALTPLGAGRARMDIDLLFRHPGGFTDAQLDDRVAFHEEVTGEDLRLQRLFEDLRLPLDPAAELHTRADRLSFHCRQLLRDLLTTGDPACT